MLELIIILFPLKVSADSKKIFMTVTIDEACYFILTVSSGVERRDDRLINAIQRTKFRKSYRVLKKKNQKCRKMINVTKKFELAQQLVVVWNFKRNFFAIVSVWFIIAAIRILIVIIVIVVGEISSVGTLKSLKIIESLRESSQRLQLLLLLLLRVPGDLLPRKKRSRPTNMRHPAECNFFLRSDKIFF